MAVNFQNAQVSNQSGFTVTVQTNTISFTFENQGSGSISGSCSRIVVSSDPQVAFNYAGANVTVQNNVRLVGIPAAGAGSISEIRVEDFSNPPQVFAVFS